jgi:hypothetical protein
MLQLLYPRYTLRVEVTDHLQPHDFAAAGKALAGAAATGQSVTIAQQHKYWNGIDKTGCDEVMAAVKKALADAGLTATVFFDKFEHR